MKKNSDLYLLKNGDITFEKWIRDVKIASATPVTAGLSMSIKEKIEEINPDILNFLIECFEKGMTPLEAVIEWA